MTIQVIDESAVIREAAEILLQHMSPAKVARFWASWQIGKGDYLQWREEAFADETVATLFEKITSFEQSGQDNLSQQNGD